MLLERIIQAFHYHSIVCQHFSAALSLASEHWWVDQARFRMIGVNAVGLPFGLPVRFSAGSALT